MEKREKACDDEEILEVKRQSRGGVESGGSPCGEEVHRLGGISVDSPEAGSGTPLRLEKRLTEKGAGVRMGDMLWTLMSVRRSDETSGAEQDCEFASRSRFSSWNKDRSGK